jgi:hypothetical protein
MSSSRSDLARFHSRFGWTSLALFATLGIVLEGLHGLKVGWYLEQANETRRLMFTLAHAHGTLLSVVNLAFGALLFVTADVQRRRLASRGLLAGTILMPAGFFLGGLYIYDGDPGLGVMLVPVGAICVVAAAASCAFAEWRPRTAEMKGDETAALPSQERQVSRTKRRKK